MQSRLSRAEVVANVSLPTRNPAKRTLLRARVPDGWRVTGAQVEGGPALTADDKGTVDLSALRGNATIRFKVAKN